MFLHGLVKEPVCDWGLVQAEEEVPEHVGLMEPFRGCRVFNLFPVLGGQVFSKHYFKDPLAERSSSEMHKDPAMVRGSEDGPLGAPHPEGKEQRDSNPAFFLGVQR